MQNKLKTSLIAMGLALSIAALKSDGQVYQMTNWVNDPFCHNQNYGLTGAGSSNPGFTNNGVQLGTLFANSAIGSTLKLTSPGDSISFSGQVIVAGDVNPDGHLQFRLGLYYQGENQGDTNWLGYMFGNVTGDKNNGSYSFFIRKHPNSGNYGAGLFGNAIVPKCNDVSYAPKWGAGTYDFELAVTLLAGNAQKIAWKLAGTPPLEYKQTGVYTNTVAATMPPAFDQVGLLGGGAIFKSASIADSITLKNATVTLSRTGEIH